MRHVSESVIDFLDAGGGMATAPPPDGGVGDPPAPVKDPLLTPLGLTTDEKAAVVEFLKTLTGQPIPAELTKDTSAHISHDFLAAPIWDGPSTVGHPR